jgi:uncharacterized membrane protein
MKIFRHGTGWGGDRHATPAIQQHLDDRTLGQRAADGMRNGMGSWTFVFAFLVAMAVWIAINSILGLGKSFTSSKGFDPYPYILLNLILSTMAGLQAAALLIAAKRSDHIASIIAEETDANTKDIKQNLEQNTELTEAIHVNTQLIHAIAHKIGLTDAEMASALKQTAGPGQPE